MLRYSLLLNQNSDFDVMIFKRGAQYGFAIILQILVGCGDECTAGCILGSFEESGVRAQPEYVSVALFLFNYVSQRLSD